MVTVVGFWKNWIVERQYDICWAILSMMTLWQSHQKELLRSDLWSVGTMVADCYGKKTTGECWSSAAMRPSTGDLTVMSTTWKRDPTPYKLDHHTGSANPGPCWDPGSENQSGWSNCNQRHRQASKIRSSYCSAFFDSAPRSLSSPEVKPCVAGWTHPCYKMLLTGVSRVSRAWKQIERLVNGEVGK